MSLENVKNWCRGKNGFVRLPFFIFFFYLWVRHLGDAGYYSVLGPLNLGIHEVGHLLFSPLGMTWNIWGGTIAQLLVPVYGMFNFYKLKDYFSVTLCFGWLATNFYYVAWYLADARSMALPLVSPFGAGARHDWNYLLTRMGVLHLDQQIAFFIRTLGSLAMLAGLISSGALIFWMIRDR